MEDMLHVHLAIKITDNYYLLASIALNIVLLFLIFILYSSSKNKQRKTNDNNSQMDYNSTRIKGVSIKRDRPNLESILREKEAQYEILLAENKEQSNIISSLNSQIQECKEGMETDSKIIDEKEAELEKLRGDLNKINSNDIDPNTYGQNSSDLQSSNGISDLAFGKCEVIDEIGYLEKAKILTHQTPYFIEENDGKILFYLNNNNKEAIANALNFYNVYIRAFCEAVNIYNPSIHKSFIAEHNSKGKLEKEGERFRVVEKLNIRFLEA